MDTLNVTNQDHLNYSYGLGDDANSISNSLDPLQIKSNISGIKQDVFPTLHIINNLEVWGGEKLINARNIAFEYLINFANQSDFEDKMNIAFGENFDTRKATDIFNKFCYGDFSELPQIDSLTGMQINSANGAYDSQNNRIYLANEFVNSHTKSQIAAVVLEEIGHSIDTKINIKDAPGDEGDIFSRLVRSESISANELLVLKTEDDHSVIRLNGQTITIEKSVNYAPTSLQFNTNKTSYNVGEIVSLTSAWVYDGNGASDLSKVDFWLKKDGGNWQDISDIYSFTPYSGDNRWASFSYNLNSLGTGNYQLWATAYDKSGATSTLVQKGFSIVQTNVAPTSLQFNTNKSFYKVGDTVSLKNPWVYDGNGASDLSKIDFWLKKDNGSWQDISDVYSLNPGSNDNRWASFNYSLSNLQIGNYTLLAKAQDKFGAYSDALQKNFSVFAYNLGEGANSPSLFENAFNRINGIGEGLKPVTSAYLWGNGWTQEFTKTADGSKMFLMSGNGINNAYWLQDSNLGEYQLLGGATGTLQDGRRISLGYPTSDKNKIQRSDGKLATWQSFSANDGKASIHYLAGVGSVATWGAIGSLYTETGGASNWVGMPTRHEYSWQGGFRSDFENGYIFNWTGSTGKTHTSFMLKDAGGTISAERAVVTAQSFEDKFYWGGGSGPTINNNDFTKWVMSSGSEPNLNSNMNCWEMVLFSGYKSGIVNRQWLTNLYGTSNLFNSNRDNWISNLPGKMSISRKNYNFNSWNQGMKRGDIVFFNGANHVAIATGTKDRYGNDEVISHWTPNNRHVEVTTIKALATSAGVLPVTFGRPIWN